MGNGGQIVFAIAEAVFDVSLPFFFCKMYSLYKFPSRRKKLGFEILLYLPEIGCYFWGVAAVQGLRWPCRD